MLVMDSLIAYAPSPVKPALYFVRRFPLAISLALVGTGLLAVAEADTIAHAVGAAQAAKHKESSLTPGDVARVGGCVAVFGSLFPAFLTFLMVRRVFVVLVYRQTCEAIRAKLAATVHKDGGLIYAAVQFRGVVIDVFEPRYASSQVDAERLASSPDELRAEYRRLSRSIDAVVRLCTESVRETKQGHMVRLILDVLHGGVLYEQVSGRTYLMGCVVNQRHMESAAGELPLANREMKELIESLKPILTRDSRAVG
jgi:hypothetical protein